MVDAALKMFHCANEVYSKDLLPIAKMMDEGKPDEEIDAAIIQLIDMKGVELEDLRADVLDLAIPYTEKHKWLYGRIHTRLHPRSFRK